MGTCRLLNHRQCHADVAEVVVHAVRVLRENSVELGAVPVLAEAVAVDEAGNGRPWRSVGHDGLLLIESTG